MDFAACLERFYESCIFSMWFKLFPERLADMQEPWKEMSRQSERQYGAFVALYFVVCGKCPVKPSQKMIEFRNNITHKGYFPTKEEALDYAKYVSSHIQLIYKEIQAMEVPFIGQFYNGLMSIWPINGDVAGHSIVTMLNLMLSFDESWENAMKAFTETFDYYYSK